MLMLLIVAFLGIGGLLFGTAFLQNSWTVVSGAAKRVVASRIFALLAIAFGMAFVFAIGGDLVGYILAQDHEVWGIEAGPAVARGFIFVSTLLSAIILGIIALLAKFFGGAITFLFPRRDLEDTVKGIYLGIVGCIMLILLGASWLVMIGIYASAEAMGGVILGVLLYWAWSIYYAKPTKWLPRIVFGTAVGLMLWWVAASIPGSFWLGVGLSNLQPKINFWGGIDNIDLKAAEMARAKALRRLCSGELVLASQVYAGTTNFQQIGRADALAEEVKRACGKGDAAALIALEKSVGVSQRGDPTCAGGVMNLREQLRKAKERKEVIRIAGLLAVKERECPSVPPSP